MRRFRFRVWDKEMKVMEVDNFYLIGQGGHLWLLTASCGVRAMDNDKYIIMQSTGLKDKNEVDIFEGDIVEWTTRNGEVFEGRIMFMKSRLQFQIAIKFSDGLEYTKVKKYRDMKVIGNVHENPKLLEAE